MDNEVKEIQEVDQKTIPSNAPEDCPGVESDNAGKSSACDGCENQQFCQTKPKGPDPSIKEIEERMKNVKHKILVLSGKGGVGKSTFSAQLTWGLGTIEKQVGLLDIDLCGPSIPRIMGCEGESIHNSNFGMSPVFINDNISVMSVGMILESPSQALIYRGPKKTGLIKNFLKDTDWGELDYLIVDTPPGTSDEHLTITSLLKNIDGAVIVTTPQQVALLDVRKEINFCKKIGLKIIGVVENMSGFVCPNCKGESVIFKPTTGGALKMCEEMDVKFLGSVPLDPKLARCCDEGKNFFEEFPESPAVVKLKEIIEKITNESK
eukprot:TRINITY_DN3141_c0_g4_i1.p1 TRINITY_DN3141_c0_g4~~TRINITY_DN3141_c0_g4_i1.p1  ORF type:complete len:321 (-),score=95.98 TRINITY_DN3141_c0_g4_i1:1-963(-)